MDRKIAPKVNQVSNFKWLEAQNYPIDSINQLYYLDATEQNVCKIELLFDAGYKHQSNPLEAMIVNELLIEGSSQFSANQIAEFVDQKGAYLETEVHADYACVQLYCLSKHFKELFDFLIDVVLDASLSKVDFQDLMQLKKQKFLINIEKVSFLAKNHFLNLLLGENHAYSKTINKNDFEKLTHNQVVDFYQSHYLNKPFTVLLSGRIKTKELEIAAKKLSALNLNQKETTMDLDLSTNGSAESLFIEKANASQSAIRLGKLMPEKSHKDFPAIFMANLLLGGFFGSRLMKNIREDKGYTYGIGSGLMNFKSCNYWFLTTEVGVNVTKAALKEIELEIQKLSKEEVGYEELETAKAYLQGTIMRNFDGAFQAMDRFKSLYLLEMNYTHYSNLLKKINLLTPSVLLETYKKYYNFDKMCQLIVGSLK